MNWDAKEQHRSREIALGYDKTLASLPVRGFNYLEKRVIRRCFSEVPDARFLGDAACSLGHLAGVRFAAKYRVHGLDISAEILGVTSKPLQNCADPFSYQVGDVKALPSHSEIYDVALCAKVWMYLTLGAPMKLLTAVSGLSRSVVVISHSLDSSYQRFRRQLQSLLGDRHSPALNWLNDSEIATILQEAGSRQVPRYRVTPLIDEAMYVVAERINPAGEDAVVKARAACTTAL